MAAFPAPREGFVLTHFIVTSDVGRSRRFYAGVLGGEVLLEGQPTIVALANSWPIINVGGPPTDDKPTVTLAPPRDPDHVSSFLNIRVADIHAACQQWRDRRRVPDSADRPGSRFPAAAKDDRQTVHPFPADPPGLAGNSSTMSTAAVMPQCADQAAGEFIRTRRARSGTALARMPSSTTGGPVLRGHIGPARSLRSA